MLLGLVSDPYFDTDRCVNRLIEVYKQHKDVIVGFDFDDTIYDYHGKGFIYREAIWLLKECSRIGLTMVLLTTQDTDQKIEDIKVLCGDMGVRVDYVNLSPILNGKAAHYPVKPFVNILLDDKAGLGQACEILGKFLEGIKSL